MPWRPALDRSQVRVGRLGIAVRRFTFLHNQRPMAHRLTLQRFARFLLAWYVAFVGVGTLSPLFKPVDLMLVCSASGAPLGRHRSGRRPRRRCGPPPRHRLPPVPADDGPARAGLAGVDEEAPSTRLLLPPRSGPSPAPRRAPARPRPARPGLRARARQPALARLFGPAFLLALRHPPAAAGVAAPSSPCGPRRGHGLRAHSAGPPTPMPSPHEEHPWHSKFVPWSCPP
jgi:hypothetical protein